MKNSKLRKVLLLACSAVLLVCLSVGATFAYLTSTATVENTFTVGKVAIDLNESKVDLNGVPVPSAAPVKKNDYKLMPGHTYTKDPTVTVKADSEACYIRAFVTVSMSDKFDKLFSEHVGHFTISDWVTLNTDWTYIDNKEDTTAKTRTYEVWYKNGAVQPAVTADTKIAPIFSEIKVPGVLTNAEIDTIQGAKITVVAQAIQADGFANADAAWDAFNK